MWVFVECTNILFNLVDYLFSASVHWVVFDKAALVLLILKTQLQKPDFVK